MPYGNPLPPLAQLADDGSLLAVLLLYKHGEAVSTTTFGHLTNLSTTAAKSLRERMEAHGLVTATRLKDRGKVPAHAITLTETGRAVGKELAAIDDLLRAAGTR